MHTRHFLANPVDEVTIGLSKHAAMKSCLQNEYRTLKPQWALSESVFFFFFWGGGGGHVKQTFKKHSSACQPRHVKNKPVILRHLVEFGYSPRA